MFKEQYVLTDINVGFWGWDAGWISLITDQQCQKPWDSGWCLISMTVLNWLLQVASEMVKKPKQPEIHFPDSSEIWKSMSGSRQLLTISYRQYSVAGLRCYIWMQISLKTSRKASAWSIWWTWESSNWTSPILEHLDAACYFLAGSTWALLPSPLCSLIWLTLSLFGLSVCKFASLLSWPVLHLTKKWHLCAFPSVAISLFIFCQHVN